MKYNEKDTVADVVRKWKEGDVVWSAEMGGLGPGYEQAIQQLAFDMLAEVHEMPCETDEEKLKVNEAMEDFVSKCDEYWWAGFSGAQVGAAKNIVMVFMVRGPYRALDAVKEERHLMVNSFPDYIKTIKRQKEAV